MSDLAERYGIDRARNRPVVAVVAIMFAAAGLAWLVWAVWLQSSPLAQSQLISFHVDGEHSAVATFTVVRRTHEVEASCLLRATAADHSVVGELDFTVGSSESATSTLTRRIRTERKATSVDLIGCVADGQSTPR